MSVEYLSDIQFKTTMLKPKVIIVMHSYLLKEE